MKDPFQDFSNMLRDALKGALDPSATNFLEMMAEDGVMEFPYSRPGGVPRVQGRAALRAYLEAIGGKLEFHSISQPIVHQSQEEGVFILEFSGTGQAIPSGLPYNQRYISVITVKDGHIVNYRDYWNPLALPQEAI